MQPYQLFGSYLSRDQTEGTIPKTEIGIVWQTQKTLSAALVADISGYKRGAFKFQVRRVKDDAVAYRLPVASRSSDLFSGVCSSDARWRSMRAACSPTGPCPWASPGAAGQSYSRGCRVARGCLARQSRFGSRAVGPTARARPARSLDRTSGRSAAYQGGHMPECLGEALVGTRRIRPLHPCQEMTRRVVRSTRVPTAEAMAGFL